MRTATCPGPGLGSGGSASSIPSIDQSRAICQTFMVGRSASGPKILLDRLVERFAADEALAQLALEQLAARGLGQGIDEDDALGHLEMRHLAGAMPDDGLLVELLAALDHDDRSHRLDPARIGQSYHGNLGHGGGAVDHLLVLSAPLSV